MTDVHDKGRRELIEAVMHDWQQRLGLGGWDIRLGPLEPSLDERAAEVDPWGEKQAAVMSIRSTAPDAGIPADVVHELLHVALDRMDDIFLAAANAAYGEQAREMAKASYREATEQAIEKITKALTGRGLECWMNEGDSWGLAFPVATNG